MSEELRGYPGGWKLEDALKEHAFSLELAYWIGQILESSGIDTVNDLGAGAGFYTAFLRRQLLNAFAYDKSPIDELSLCTVYGIDLSCEYDWELLKGTDWQYTNEFAKRNATLCLEVGEHIEQKYESIVLDNIAKSASKKIIMSWAIPGQGGFGHVNCQPNDYIIAQMEARGWKHNPEQSDFLRARCSGCPWFENTIMVFDK